MTFFEEFCKVVMLNLKMNDPVSLHVIFICLRYALFPVQIFACACKTKLNNGLNIET